jgi:hypothetical protein
MGTACRPEGVVSNYQATLRQGETRVGQGPQEGVSNHQGCSYAQKNKSRKSYNMASAANGSEQ